jgi:hypothetical protein
MPKIPPDESLCADVELLVDRHGSPAAAARVSGIDRSTLGRIRKSGCALEINARKIRDAAASIKNDKNATKSVAGDMPPDLRTVREACLSLIMIIDWYEAWSSHAQMNSGRQGISTHGA